MAEAQKRSIIFMGTPEFGAIILKRLLSERTFDISAVFTRQDKPAGRGMKPAFSEVKKVALAYGLPVFQPADLRGDEHLRLIRRINPHYLVVASFGLILPPQILNTPGIAPLNVHASLLPYWRGAAPIQRAIMAGAEDVTGVSIMKMTPRLDAGPVYRKREVAINGNNAQEMSQKLANIGADLLIETIQAIENNNLLPVEQDESRATYAEKISKRDCEIDWRRTVREIEAQILALSPSPGARATFNLIGRKEPVNVLILSARGADGDETGQPGVIRRLKGSLEIGCADGWLRVEQLRPQNRKAMTGSEFANGQCQKGICGQAIP